MVETFRGTVTGGWLRWEVERKRAQRKPGRYGEMIKGALSGLAIVAVFTAWVMPFPSHAEDKAPSEAHNAARGKLLFSRHCAGCHGPQGQGDGYKLLGADPANLTAPSTTKKPDSALLATIHEGKPNMPSWKGILSEQDIHNVLAYVRSLSK
ncbi:MAG: hypothetical protein DYH04_00195 [Nitrospira sp. NTP2]|nr:hypothetical protein [Nitrospira sp. NTP2]RIK61269.1 MAG: hypothetical protein DCC63_00580 [Nitrospira sp.]